MEEHTHCKLCQAVIKKPDSKSEYFIFEKEVIYYTLDVCEKCVIKEGIKSIKKRRKRQ